MYINRLSSMSARRSFLRLFSSFIPDYIEPDSSDIKSFQFFLLNFHRILILTGAGVSTESGIPDYRSENVGMFARSYKPIQYSEFVKNPDARKKYWARNFVGWPKFSSFEPNKIHFYITELQAANKVVGLITQNIDGLHNKAGSIDVLDLHGNAFWVSCMQCDYTMSRYDFQRILKNCNPYMNPSSSKIRPDGDIELSEEDTKNFEVPSCEKCGGILKPTVVFFGENIPKKRIRKAENLVDECDSMLILGTSLSTSSTVKLLQKACDLCKFLCLINIGPTECDKFINLKINTRISNVILCDRLIHLKN